MLNKQKKAVVISVVNEKGGSGKTTTITNLAAGLIQLGYKVALVNLDTNNSVTNWNNKRDEQKQIPLVAEGKSFKTSYEKIKNVFDIILVDNAADISSLVAESIALADLVVIPVQPSPFDTDGSSRVVELVKACQKVNKNKPKAAFLISREIANTTLSKEVEENLRAFEIPTLSSRIRNRVVYQKVLTSGGTVAELPLSDVARKEVDSLIEEILNYVK